MNFAINARDAMANGGRLTVGAENRWLDRNGAAAVGDITPGRYVALTLTDTGAGIPSHVLSRVFEPFYTTKEVGKGSGLGLSRGLRICPAIRRARQHPQRCRTWHLCVFILPLDRAGRRDWGTGCSLDRAGFGRSPEDFNCEN